MIIKQSTPKPMQQTNILILRRTDLLPTRENIPFHEIDTRDFRQLPADFEAATDVVFIDGTNHKVFKATYDLGNGYHPYKASNFHPSRHKVNVIDDVLVCSFGDDLPLGIKAGTLFCQPWTDADDAATDQDVDVMGVTVTRQDGSGAYRMFHDRGVFIPAN